MAAVTDTHLSYVRSFLVLAECLQFKEAARRLHISQPGLSRRINELEKHLGADLFDRAGRCPALTRAGEVLLPRARTIIAAWDAAARDVRAAGSGPPPPGG
jgi:DNA-binding transcriptional LysR family regulator